MSEAMGLAYIRLLHRSVVARRCLYAAVAAESKIGLVRSSPFIDISYKIAIISIVLRDSLL